MAAPLSFVSEAKLGQRLSLGGKAERQGDGLRSGGAADGGNMWEPWWIFWFHGDFMGFMVSPLDFNIFQTPTPGENESGGGLVDLNGDLNGVFVVILW